MAGDDKADGRARGAVGSRGVLREIDGRMAALDVELERYKALLEERNRLAAARAALTGERAPAGLSAVTGRRVSQDEIADYLREHPGSKAGDIARAVDAPLTNISQHLYRGKHERFESRGDGWHLKDPDDHG